MELVSTAWEVISAALVFLTGMGVALLTGRAVGSGDRRSLLLYLWHTIFCVFYAVHAQTNVADANGYYQAALDGHITFSLGTAAVEYLTYICASILHLSFLGAFLFYNVFGVIGLLAFDASLRSATADKSRLVRTLGTIIVLLPSLSYWSSAIGKDAPAFMATGLALWAALDLKRRAWLMVTAIAVMLSVRPHVGGLMILALAGSQVIQRKAPLSRRLILGGAAMAAAAAAVPFAMTYAGLNESANADDVTAYVLERQQVNLEGGSSLDIASMSLPMQLFTYLLRPLPFEAHSLLALGSAIDNTVLCLLLLGCGWRLITRRKRARTGNRAFMWLYVLLTWVVLATTTANLGISMRQKWMFTPVLVFLLISSAKTRRPVYHHPEAKGR
jgi:hypothetical protein